MTDASSDGVRCVSLGLFILDEYRTLDGATTSITTSIIGGGGTYAILGARCWLPATALGLIVDRGDDWEQSVQDKLEKFGKEMWHFRDNKGMGTCRALNLYTGQHRDFKYLTPRRRLDPSDLPPHMRAATHLHFVCSPVRSLEIHAQLSHYPDWHPRLVYEPIPDRCVPEELPSLRKILPHLTVFSPNHEEAHAFYGTTADEANRLGREGIEQVARRLQQEGDESPEFVVIRSGALGAFALKKGETKGTWTDAYHEYREGGNERVKDPTGAGNAFMGGLMAGLSLDASDLTRAVQMGSVSASYVIEQFSLPNLTKAEDGKTELWNGSLPADRLAELARRHSELLE